MCVRSEICLAFIYFSSFSISFDCHYFSAHYYHDVNESREGKRQANKGGRVTEDESERDREGERYTRSRLYI